MVGRWHEDDSTWRSQQQICNSNFIFDSSCHNLILYLQFETRCVYFCGANFGTAEMCCLGGSILSFSRMKRSFVATVSWNWNTEGFVTWTWKIQLSNEKSPGCLGYTGDNTTQLYRDYNKTLDIRIQDPYYCWVVSIMFYFHPKPWGRWTHFDEHIFQMGWTRQFSCDWWLVLFRCFFGNKYYIIDTHPMNIQVVSNTFRNVCHNI